VTRILDTPDGGRERWAVMIPFPRSVTGPRGRAAAVGVVAILASACGGSTWPIAGGGDVTLAAGQYALYSGTQVAGALKFPAAAGGAQYLVVAQFATGTAGVTAAFSLAGSAAALPAVASAAPVARAAPSAAAQFHDMLRRTEARLAAEARAAGVRAAAPGVLRSPAAAVPPVVGSQRSFKVCGDMTCTLATMKTVLATAKYVGLHAAIYLDDSLPPGGFAPADIQQVGQQFDSDLYPVDRLAFGDESDIDNNGVVVILLTPKVNALVTRPACSDAFITGFFYGADLIPQLRAQYNNGEVFYGMVPDPAGTVSCAYSVTLVRRLITVTFIHEFQHMISFNQHALVRNGDTEVLWLNEALSHLAEELGGLHYDSLGVDTTASRFYIGDLYNAAKYLHDPLLWAPVTETSPGELAERGAAWLFVRYLTDRYGTQVPRALVNAGLLGQANVEAATGASFADLLGRWALALYVSDLPGFTAPAPLTFTKWRFRTTFGSLHAQLPVDFDRAFPLIPRTETGSTVAVSGTLRSGTGAFVVVTQPAGPGFSLDFRTPSGDGFPASAGAQLAVVRLQ
jgi:hypothetical protein